MNSSKWSLPSTCSSSESSTSSSGSGRSTAWRRKEGTQRRVTAATTPSAPSDDARGAQLVAAVERRAPSRRRARAPSPRRPEARLPSRAPVPCVPVTSAPASDCTSMSPRFGSASPWPCSSRTSRCRPMPASARTSPLARSTSSTRSSRSSESSVPSVGDAARERVPGARHAHRAPAGDGLAQLGPAPRSHVLGGRARLPARPVRPHAARLPPHELGARARGAAPARGARARDGRRGAGGAPARLGPADGARADRAPVRPRHVPRDRRARRQSAPTTRTAS